MNILKSILPDNLYQFLVKIYKKARLKYIPEDDNYQGKSHSEIFSEVYKNKLWAQGEEGSYLDAGTEFYSGSGSYNKSSQQYVDFITGYIKTNNIKSITDIGCGDFNIGKRICEQSPGIIYNGVDVVPDLINSHNKNYGSENIKFYRLDTLKDKIPQSDLLLIRQVLQHLSNNDIAQLTKNCFPGFKHILITEHQLKPQFLIKENIEKSPGPNTRLAGSGVYLNKPPFAYRWTKVLTGEDSNQQTEINTFKIDN